MTVERKVAVKEIVIGPRIRKYHIAEGLARSIEKHGLIQPIVVNQRAGKTLLVSGERRLRATKKLKHKTIHARVYENLTDEEMVLMELEENQERRPLSLARIMHETPSRDRGDGRATGQPQGLGPEAYFSTLQGTRPEDARKDGQIRGRSRWFVHNAG